MSTAAVIAIAIGVVIVLAGVVDIKFAAELSGAGGKEKSGSHADDPGDIRTRKTAVYV